VRKWEKRKRMFFINGMGFCEGEMQIRREMEKLRELVCPFFFASLFFLLCLAPPLLDLSHIFLLHLLPPLFPILHPLFILFFIRASNLCTIRSCDLIDPRPHPREGRGIGFGCGMAGGCLEGNILFSGGEDFEKGRGGGVVDLCFFGGHEVGVQMGRGCKDEGWE
jgi:hypothetical protein